MSETLTISIKILTPIWTGDVNGRCSEIKETGIIGSLRWWYEAIVRGLGGYVCDSLNESCEFDTKGYGNALRSGKSIENALAVGLKEVCPVCRLFGCGGLKRQFQLYTMDAPTTPLHFRTSVDMNKNWLRRIFGGESQDIDNLNVFYGELTFRFLLKGNDTDYIRSQLVMLFRFISEYGGLGAKLQHGFGEIEVLKIEPQIRDKLLVEDGLNELSRRIQKVETTANIPYNLEHFILLEYVLSAPSLKPFMMQSSHIGKISKNQEDMYIPCAFDLRYKGKDKFGMRRWLKEIKKWSESDNPKKLGQIDQLLGPRSQWDTYGKTVKIDENFRTASRLCFGMPYKIDDKDYRLRIFGFAPPSLMLTEGEMTVNLLDTYCQEYMKYAFNEGIKSTNVTFGKDIITSIGGNT